ncbi:hypothetical protein B0F90DRAFT_1814671 [Multifurca ochricompacta]|uniref:Zn(2)-C6 fungal-type domain-containing protein n=1 Tax=Multifurca ochricompacta TaxID=376703 RepID=A0AAD4MA27_9AGAM|nr:hypothetical protein B0F90DRAFT_1814671 [Multifurca ochricompacta]
MDRFTVDRFPSDPSSTSTTSFSSLQQPIPPTSQTSFRSSDEPDPFKISFLKGPKRKRLAKACDACHKSKRRCDGTAPCSNCYFAAKDCTYTDSSGRPVPAPLASKTDKPPRAGPSQSRRRPQKDSYLGSPVSASANSLSSARGEPLTSPQAPSDTRDDYAETSKRPRVGSISFPALESQVPSSLVPRSTFTATRFEVPVVRELVNLFFAHCHPHRLFFHQPTFMADVSLGRIPSYLIYALCALSAPLSRHPAVRTDSPRTAGLAYSKAAEEQMFDAHGRLIVERNLMTAQALCLLESHQSLLSWPWPSPSTHHQLALGILKDDLHVQDEHHSGLPSAPTTSFVLDAIGRECARRAVWYIRLMHLTIFAYFQIAVPAIPMDLDLRLPVDEASFEFGAHSSQSEYLNQPAPRTQYASEYGHLLRIASVHGRLEATLHPTDILPSTHDAAKVVVEETEKDISAWESSLADHVRFSEESAAHHLAMFETSSNAGAWCYFMMHALYAWCVLTLSEARTRGLGTVTNGSREWACDRLMLIGTKLGSRSKNSVLLVAILSALNRFGMSDHPQVMAWSREFTETYGMDPKCKSGPRMPLAEALASSNRPTPPLLLVPQIPASTTGADRVEDRSDTSSTSSSGTYFSSLRNSYNKLRLTSLEPAPGPGPSLPSLKSCGLLESWAHPLQPPSQQLPDAAGMSELPTSPTPPWMVLRTATVSKDSAIGPSETATSPSTSSRGTKSTMPVGLDWLAHEQ